NLHRDRGKTLVRKGRSNERRCAKLAVSQPMSVNYDWEAASIGGELICGRQERMEGNGHIPAGNRRKALRKRNRHGVTDRLIRRCDRDGPRQRPAPIEEIRG